jgi:hypothetical protein
MNKMPNTILMLLLISSLVLNGCGGGDVFAEGGIGGTGISTGTVTAIGSITVNGVTYNTDNAAIYIEGRRVDEQCIVAVDAEDCLRNILGFSEGQVVRVVENFDADGRTGTADEVYYNDSIEGPVEADSIIQIDATTLRLVVMNQIVIVNSQTKLFDDATGLEIALSDIQDNDLIEVSGLIDELGRIQAGYLLNKGPYDSSDSVELKGIIDTNSLNLSSFTFRINGLLIDYSSVTPSPDLQQGMQVEVKGTYNGTQIDAISVEQDDDIDGKNNDEVEYEGIVTIAPVPFTAGDDFLFGLQAVRTDSNTVFKGGLADDIVAGVRLEVEGYLASGILIAEEVSFHDDIEIDAPAVNHTFIDGVITIELVAGLTPPITVVVNDLSKIEGNVQDLNELDISLLDGTTDYVQVRGRLVGSGVVYAEEIKAETWSSSDPQVIKLQGKVEQIDDIGLIVTILGIDVDATTIADYEDVNDQAIDQAEFFATVVLGNIVSAEGKLISGLIEWDKLEIEDEE